jgi:hypothetical protein
VPHQIDAAQSAPLLLNERRRQPDQPAHAPVEGTKALVLRLPAVKTIVDLLQNHGQFEDPENFVVPDVSEVAPGSLGVSRETDRACTSPVAT